MNNFNDDIITQIIDQPEIRISPVSFTINEIYAQNTNPNKEIIQINNNTIKINQKKEIEFNKKRIILEHTEKSINENEFLELKTKLSEKFQIPNNIEYNQFIQLYSHYIS